MKVSLIITYILTLCTQNSNPSKGKYVRDDDIHTNSIESFWSTLKRGIIDIYYQVSTKHLQQYVNEFCFRYDERKSVNAFDELMVRTVG